ncbi:MAG: HTH domain-containing protein, partial [Eubacteriales bacterium]|nr:HTH domain-containing protein [Eubacteriales bacterium]
MKPSLKDNVLRELIATSQSGEVISGQNLAIKYSVSRNAIWKTIKALQADGYAIIAGKNRGYILEGNYDILSREDISARLADKVVTDIGIFVHDEIDSTNSEAKRLLTDGICEPFLVVADSQTAGRGRFGRSFYSPPGTGVYMTLVVSPEIETNAPVTITAAAAV